MKRLKKGVCLQVGQQRCIRRPRCYALSAYIHIPVICCYFDNSLSAHRFVFFLSLYDLYRIMQEFFTIFYENFVLLPSGRIAIGSSDGLVVCLALFNHLIRGIVCQIGGMLYVAEFPPVTG